MIWYPVGPLLIRFWCCALLINGGHTLFCYCWSYTTLRFCQIMNYVNGWIQVDTGGNDFTNTNYTTYHCLQIVQILPSVCPSCGRLRAPAHSCVVQCLPLTVNLTMWIPLPGHPYARGAYVVPQLTIGLVIRIVLTLALLE